MKKLVSLAACATVVAFAAHAPGASAQRQVTPEVKDCKTQALLLTGMCSVAYKCPASARFCLANGAVEVIADKPFGMVKGDVWVIFPPGPGARGAVTARCGAPDETVRRCTTQTQILRVPRNTQVEVTCHANRHFPTIGVLTTDIFCRGNFASVSRRR